MNAVIRFDKKGAVYGAPHKITSGDTVGFELIGEDLQLSDGVTSTLSLRANKFSLISAGVVELGFGGDTVEINAVSLNAFTVGIALNSLDAIRDAGGVEVSAQVGGYEVYFLKTGARDALTVSHSAAGSLSGRCVTLNAGSASAHATYFLDLSISVIAKTSSVTALTAAAATIATVTAGDASTAQVQRLTVSRMPDSGQLQLDLDGSPTRWFSPSVSAYDLRCILDDVAEDEFIVDRRDYGTVTEWLVTRTDKGVSSALTIQDTFVGPAGLSASLDLSGSQTGLISFGSIDSLACRLEYEYDGKTLFSVPVELAPDLPTQAAVA